jgi:hypothetical protein
LQLCYLVGEDVEEETVLISREGAGHHVLLRAVAPFNCSIVRPTPGLRRQRGLQARTNRVRGVWGNAGAISVNANDQNVCLP